MKPKINRKGTKDTANSYDSCQTPYYAVAPLIPYLPRTGFIWESACGRFGFLADALTDYGFTVVGTDICFDEQHNFFTLDGGHCAAQVTNPPYSIKFDWLAHSYEIGKPFALLVPVETIGAARGQRMADTYGAEFILLDKRVDFCMPEKGFNGNGSQFPTMWWTWGLHIGRQMTYAQLNKPKKREVHNYYADNNESYQKFAQQFELFEDASTMAQAEV